MTGGDLRGALEDLYARIPLGMRLGLAPMEAACASFDHPERAFATVHVAGTNGKGSVCAMVESIARANGLRTGLFTSPHLCRFAERIRIGGTPIDDHGLASLLRRVLARAPDLSFFETATLAAFEAFREAKVDLAILEVGIGGRLDATNVIPTPRVGAITRIALDHTDRLGPSLVAIAREKAGIAKPGLSIVLGPMEPEVRRAIDAIAAARGATTVASDEHVARIRASGPLKLQGRHQIDNAAVAYAVGARIGASDRECLDGILRAEWPGRLETIPTDDGDVLLDAAHNPDGSLALARHLEALEVPPGRVALVFGALADKAWRPMLDALVPRATHRFYVRPAGRAPADPGAFAAYAPGEVHARVSDALTRARTAVGPQGLVVVTGSIFLVGEVRALLLGLERDPAVAL